MAPRIASMIFERSGADSTRIGTKLSFEFVSIIINGPISTNIPFQACISSYMLANSSYQKKSGANKIRLKAASIALKNDNIF
jgi:hypothetical protein